MVSPIDFQRMRRNAGEKTSRAAAKTDLDQHVSSVSLHSAPSLNAAEAELYL